MGAFHPIVVHFAVSLLLIGALMFWVAQIRKFSTFQILVGPINGLGTLAGLGALWTGWHLSDLGYYAGDSFEAHRLWAFSAVAIGTITSIWLLFFRNKIAGSIRVLQFLFLLQAVLIIGTGSKGGDLTHGHKPWIKNKKDSTDYVIDQSEREAIFLYDDLIQPILNSKCIACHNKEESRGGLSLVDYESMWNGGSSGRVVVASNSGESSLFQRVTLAKNSSKFMPPTGWPLSYDEINLIEHWIQSGAGKEATLLDHPAKESRLMAYIEEVYGIKNGYQSKIERQNSPTWNPKVALLLSEYPRNLQKIAANTQWLSLRIDQSYSKEFLKELSEISEYIAWIDAGNSKILPKDFEVLGPLPNLVRLSLDMNNWDDNEVSILSNYKSIEFLNMYGNPVGSDSIMPIMSSCRDLKKIILGNTKIDEEKKSGIIQNYPGVEVI